jgi:iron complex outermembrane recepter protein
MECEFLPIILLTGCVGRAIQPRKGIGGEKMREKLCACGGSATRRPPKSFLRPATPLRAFVALVSFLLILASPAGAEQKAVDLANQSLEDLMNVKVVSVSRTEEKMSRTAAAIFVITQEDIRRSGATNIPDLLRMVPGMDVGQIDANTWAIGARGFNERFGNELFVMVDGRSIYTPSFGGVYWEALDIPLEDIERIEVIRGPGGSIWGTNAVNGVINIITKKASETKGAVVTAGGGNIDQGFGLAQFGGAVGKSTDYRVFTKYFNQDHLPAPAGGDGGDGWHSLRAGFRADTTLSPRDSLTFQGDLYSMRIGNAAFTFPSVTTPAPVPTDLLVNMAGGYIQGVWSRAISARSGTTLQISYDRYKRNDTVGDDRGTLNLDFSHHFEWGERNAFVWGVNFLDSDAQSRGTFFASFIPADLNLRVYGAFIQDEIAISPDQLYLTVGAKLEHNHYTGFNLMPSARIAWTPTPKQTLWAAVSDAVRSPAEIDTNFRANLAGFYVPGDPTPFLVAYIGNPNVQDESLIAYEFGYRRVIGKQFSIDFSSYYNDYNHQDTTEPAPEFFEPTPAPAHIVIPVTYENLMYGETQGIEVFGTWKVTNHWTLNPGYAFEEIHMHLRPTSQDTTSVAAAEGASPHHSAELRSRVDLPHGLTWDSSAYFVDRLTDPAEPSYTRLDSQLSWRFGEGGSISLVGQNLLKSVHQEFADSTNSARTNLMKRSAYVKFTWKF